MGKSLAGIRGGPSINLDSLKDKELSSSSDEMPTEAQKVGRGCDPTDESDTLQLMGTWRFVSLVLSKTTLTGRDDLMTCPAYGSS